jgi:hypothetical protein
MTIYYTTNQEMIEIVKSLVMGGFTFEVFMSNNKIELTGGY